MKTKIEKLQSEIKANRGLVSNSLHDLLCTGFSYTGKSGYSKGWATKSIWTSDVCQILSYLKIKFEFGNNAPRGGANGEFVKIIDKVLLKQIKERRAKVAIEVEKIKLQAEKARQEAYSKVEAYIATLPSTEQLEAKWNSLELKSASGLSWSSYRDNLKSHYLEDWKILKAKFRAKQAI